MRNAIQIAIASLLLLASGLAQAQAYEPGVYYRCEAFGKKGKEQIVVNNENSLLKYAQSGALRDCRLKGGRFCRLGHCFKMRVNAGRGGANFSADLSGDESSSDLADAFAVDVLE